MCVSSEATLLVAVMVMTALPHGLYGTVTETIPGGVPVFTEEPTDEIVRRNDPLTLYCKATGDPPPRITWYRTDSEAPLRDRDSRMQLPDGSLFFYRLRGRDRGTYYCVARSTTGAATSRRVTVQMAYLRETFRKSPLSLGVNEGESAVFECDPPKGHPTPVVTWRLDERDLILPRHRYRQDGSTLMVSHVVPSDEGEYQCVVTNMAGRRVSEVAQLTVYESARVGGVVKSMVGVAGHDVTLPCVPSGKPDPQVVWRRADGLMPVGRAAMGRDWSLTITALRSGDQGTYVCEATNSAGTHAANTSLLVVERPRAEGGVRPRIAVITPSHVRQIGCPITATPTPIIFWVKENHGRQEAQREAGHTLTGDGEDVYRLEEEQPWVVASGAAATVEEAAPIVDHTFSLHVTTRHEGLWACMAANEVGGVVMPVRVVGGGVARGTVSVGMVGVDEVEARAALLTPTLEQGFPSSSTPTSATVTWRLIHRSKHIEGIYVLGCERGSGFIHPRIQQQLQTHDISLLHHPHSHHSHQPAPTTHTMDQRESSTSEHVEWPDSGGGPHTSLAEENVEHILLENESGRSTTSSNTTGVEEGGDDFPCLPTCSNLRVMGHTLVLARSSFQVMGLHPFTSYWFLLLPHYKGVLGVPSNMQSFTTPQDVPAGWPVLSRWWAARVGPDTYALTLHWRPLPPHLAHGVINRYQVLVRERDTGITHNVSVMGDLTTLTLPNVTSSRVEVSMAASTVKGTGSASPPTNLNLLMTHHKEPGVGVGLIRSAWFLVLAGGAVTMLVVLVGCTLAARWCAHSLTHSSLPADMGHSKVGGPWVDVGGLWTSVPTHDLSSDKSERKLLANGSSLADYVEVEAEPQLKDETGNKRLEVWPGGLLSPSPSPSRVSSSSHQAKQLAQSESLLSQPRRASHCMLRQQTSGSYASSSAHHTSSTCRNSDTGTWYTGEYCNCYQEDSKLGLHHEPFCPSATPSGCSTVLHVSLNPPSDYACTSVGTDTYEAVTTYEEAGIPLDLGPGKQPSATRQLRLNTESTTDLSMDCYNYSDDDPDATQSFSDTEASFFIPQELRRRDPSKENDSSCEDLHRPLKEQGAARRTASDDAFQRELQKVVEKKSDQDKNKQSNSLRYLYCVTESPSNCDSTSAKPLSAESLKRISSRSSMSQDSLENQFEQTLRMISQGASCNLDSDSVSVSAFD
ncbi:hypothetical protein O3P69_006293 [Scylla paramamosain]|uniref:Ig-like domain-containing protein n=2 Tax=Scylla paramamosain TaxID=85552 RepID=A0AAW0U1R0_SCYPA